MTLKSSIKFSQSLIDSVEFSPSVVHEYLCNVDVSKACGPDLLPGFLLKHCAEFIAPPLAYLFTFSMRTGTLPQDWVTANIVPVFKRNKRNLACNYRPISLTSLVVKTMERIILSHLTDVLIKNGLLNSHQYGFRKAHSTSHLLIEAVNDWAEILECRGSCHCLLLDFAKAFDSVPHQRLLLKLASIGITGHLLQWIDHFLTSRSQRVVINGKFSKWLPVLSGVPQGSILGPLLFIIYVNDITSVVQSSSVRIFADDVSLYAKVSSLHDCLMLHDDLSRIYNWSIRWQLHLNPNKCEAINITNKRTPVSFTYLIGSQPISWVSKVRYLGVVINSKLNWSDHCQKIVQKASLCLNRLRRAMYGCTDVAKSLAYKALVRPCLEYGCTVWSPYTIKNINLLESVQRRAARWIKSKYDSSLYRWTKSTDDCLEELKWPTLELRRQYQTIVMVYSILHKQTPIIFSHHFGFNTNSTRSHPLALKIRSSSINAFRYSFYVNAPFVWNSIPYEILSLSSNSLFRSRLRCHLLT